MINVSEYVSLGHPDKVADYISEYILDRLLEQDPNTRYALEVQIKDNHVTLGGEITTAAKEQYYDHWVKQALAEIGYTQEYCDKWGKENTIDPSQLTVDAHISTQSPDIAQGVNNNGWGDQGIFWGLATHDQDGLPDDYRLAKKLGDHLYKKARDGASWGLDIKTQFVVSTDTGVDTVVVAAPCKPEDYDGLVKYVHELLEPTNAKQIVVNGTGTYIKHASIGDCGTTGRKLAVDFYGGNCPIGGGSPWTKDGTKADLALNLYARYVATETLKAQPGCKLVRSQLSCCIGAPEITIQCFDEHNNPIAHPQHLGAYVTPNDIIKLFKLRKPLYADLCAIGMWAYVDLITRDVKHGQTEEETSGR